MNQVSPTTSRVKSLRLFERQRELLRLLDELGGRVGNLDFQKLLFLYCQETGETAPYEFVPYRYGAFSFTCYADRRKLVERGLLGDDENHWRLTADGQRAVAGAEHERQAAFAHRYRDMRGNALVAETYRRFPYYAGRSEIAHRVLAGDANALRRVEETRPNPRGQERLTTIGYEGLTLERYLNKLLGAGVTVLCDVRKNPISRKYGFSKSTLGKGCEGVGIRYEHLRELGIDSDRRRHLETQADYDALFEEYRRTSLPSQWAAIGQIRGWIEAGEYVALTCYERLPEQCHRSCVAEAVAEKLGGGSGAQHL